MRTTTIPNGNAGQFSQDGRFVYYGNWKVGMLDRATGVFGDLCEGWPGGELSPAVLGVTSSQNVSNPEWRRFYQQPAVIGSPRVELPIPQDTIPRYASEGHVYGVKWGKPYPDGQVGDYFYKDGVEFFPTTQQAIAGIMLAGNFFLTFRPNTSLNPTWIYHTDGQFIRNVSLDGTGANDQFQRYAKIFQGPHKDAYVFQGSPAGMVMNAPDNGNYFVAPLIYNDSHAALVWWKDVSYAVTIAALTQTDSLVMVRPVDGRWGPKAICVKMPIAYPAAIVTADGELLICGTDNTGGPQQNWLTVADQIWMDTAHTEDPHEYAPDWTGPPPAGPGGEVPPITEPPVTPPVTPPAEARIITIPGPLKAGDIIKIV